MEKERATLRINKLGDTGFATSSTSAFRVGELGILGGGWVSFQGGEKEKGGQCIRSGGVGLKQGRNLPYAKFGTDLWSEKSAEIPSDKGPLSPR